MTATEVLPILAESFFPLPLAAVLPEHPGLWFVLLVALVLVNAFFVAAEIALVRIHTSQLEEAEAENRKGARRAVELAKNADRYLAACQIGITLSSIVLGAVGEPFLSALLAPLMEPWGWDEGMIRWISFAIAVLVLTIVHVIIGEQIPRTVGFRKTVGTTIVTSGPLRVFFLLCAAPVWFTRVISHWVTKSVLRLQPVDIGQANTTADELRLMVEETGRAREVTETEQEILENALELNELCVRDILTPRNEVVVLDVHRTFRENLDIALETKHTRFPLVDAHLDKTLGLIHIKDLFREMQKDAPNLFAAKRDLLRVSEMLPLDDLLKLFLAKRAHIALVVDEFGGSIGLVMFDDVLDQLVGEEIYDEFDEEEEPGFVRIDEDTFLAQGWFPLHELADEVDDLELEDPDVSTVGGFVTNLFGRIPDPGETENVPGYLVTVTKSDDRIIEEMRFERVPDPDEDGEAEKDDVTESVGAPVSKKAS